MTINHNLIKTLFIVLIPLINLILPNKSRAEELNIIPLLIIDSELKKTSNSEMKIVKLNIFFK